MVQISVPAKVGGDESNFSKFCRKLMICGRFPDVVYWVRTCLLATGRCISSTGVARAPHTCRARVASVSHVSYEISSRTRDVCEPRVFVIWSDTWLVETVLSDTNRQSQVICYRPAQDLWNEEGLENEKNKRRFGHWRWLHRSDLDFPLSRPR